MQTWVTQVDREFKKQKHATSILWEDKVIVVNYMRCVGTYSVRMRIV